MVEKPVGRVVLLQQQEIEREGRMIVAQRSGMTGLVAYPIDEMDAIAPGDWTEDSSIIVDLSDGCAEWDHFSRIPSIGRLVETAGRPRRLVAIVADIDNPMLRLRLQHAGATEVISWSALRRSADWLALLAGSLAGEPPDVAPSERSVLAVGDGCDIEGALAWVQAAGCESAFCNASSQVGTGYSRRQILRIRREVGSRARMYVPAHRVTGGLERRQDLPFWRDVVQVVNLARGAARWSVS